MLIWSIRGEGDLSYHSCEMKWENHNLFNAVGISLLIENDFHSHGESMSPGLRSAKYPPLYLVLWKTQNGNIALVRLLQKPPSDNGYKCGEKQRV